MKILLLTTHLNPGGIASYVVSLARGLKASGETILIASSGGGCVDLLAKEGIEHIVIPIRTKSELSLKVLISFFKLRKIIRENKIQIIHSQTRVTQVLGFLLSKFSGVVFISTCHGFFRPRFFRRIFPCWGKRVIAISQYVRKHLVDDFNVDKQKISLVYNGINASDYRIIKDPVLKAEAKKRFGLDKRVVIGIVARLSPVKGHKFLILAFKELSKVIANGMLFIVGDGPDKDNLLNLVKELNIQDHVLFHPSVEDTSEILGAMDIFCVPSLKEGLGLSILEASISGIPVVAASVGGIGEIITHNKTGILIPSSDPSAIKEAIINLIDDSGLRNSITENAFSLVKEKFSLAEMVSKTIKVYNVSQ